MNGSEPTFLWTDQARRKWQSMEKARNLKNFYLALAVGPYLITACMMALGGEGHTQDSRALIAVGGGIFLLFVLISPYWLFITLWEWKKARNKFRGTRKFFKDLYKFDPCQVVPPDEPSR